MGGEVYNTNSIFETSDRRESVVECVLSPARPCVHGRVTGEELFTFCNRYADDPPYELDSTPHPLRRYMREEHQIKAIFFDAGGTLLYIHPSVGKVYADVTREMGVDLSDERIESRLHEIWEDYAPTNRVREGNYRASDERDRDMWKEFLRRLYEDLEPLQELEFDEWFDELFHRFGEPGTFRLYDETLETIRTLKRAGLHVGVVSNWDSRLFSICKGLNIDRHVDFILPSAVAGYRKPSERIFEQALDSAGVQPEEAMHIGDKHLDDYEGSKSVGLTPVLLDRNNNHDRRDATVISSLDQVIDILDMNANALDSI